MAKRALLIGINRYALPGADLRGCVNDVEDMGKVLVEEFGFAPGDLTTLLDEQATQAAMQQGIEELVASGKPGDVLFLHYSGHGSNVKDTTGDEADGRDEILCPHDLDWNRPLTDDWLRTTFDKLEPGASLTVVMDCCHSGTNTRAPAFMPPDAPAISRFLRNPDDSGAPDGPAVPTKRARRRRRTEDVHAVPLTEALLTGCRDTQTCADADIDGSYHGALTYYLVKALRSLGSEATYRQVHATTAAGLKGSYDQVPQLEARESRLDRPFLSAQG